MSGCGQLLKSRLFLKKYNILNLRFSSTDTSKIEIPNRIERGPTDILRALESTVHRDPTAPHYKYHDDPYLIPTSNMGKRTFALAKESGRKAAHWVRQQNPDLFQHKEAQPEIKAFVARMVYDENSDVTEKDLLNVVNDCLVSEALLVYKLLKSKSVDVSPEIQQKLLELLCFYNGQDALDIEFIEERWFRQSTSLKERQRKTWRDGDVAEELFIGLENPNVEAYSALIQGMAKFGQAERAWQLFQEAQGKGLLFPTNTYNAILSVTAFLKEGYPLRWEFTLNTLSMMANAKVKPNLGTLNAVLETLSTMGGGRIVRENILKVLAEFKTLGIEPSLASWYYVLISVCKPKGPVSPILHDIMNHLEGKEFQIRDMKDTFFFVTAMDVCHNHLRDKDLAKRVNNLLHVGNNYDLIGDSFKESIYYRHYVTLLCMTEPLDDFMNEVYYPLVPNVYVPEPSVMLEILNTIDANAALKYLPKLWSDITIFDHVRRENVLDSFLKIVVNNETTDLELLTSFAEIAWKLWNKLANPEEVLSKRLGLTGEIAGNIMIILLRNKDFENACEVMEKLDSEQKAIVGVPPFEALSLFVDVCIEEKTPTRAINCIEYCADAGFTELETLVKRVHESFTLDETHLGRLSKIVGSHFFHTKLENKQEEK